MVRAPWFFPLSLHTVRDMTTSSGSTGLKKCLMLLSCRCVDETSEKGSLKSSNTARIAVWSSSLSTWVSKAFLVWSLRRSRREAWYCWTSAITLLTLSYKEENTVSPGVECNEVFVLRYCT